jgi:hypothetical protein
MAEGFQKFYKVWVDDNLSNLKQFHTLRLCFANKWFVKNGDGQDLNPIRKNVIQLCPKPLITVWSGGSIHFPYKQRDKVLQEIARDIESGTPMCFNQLAYEDNGFRLVIDVDSGRLMLNDEIMQFAFVLTKTLREYYTNFNTNPIPIIIEVCGPRMKNLKISTAIHFKAHVSPTMEEARQLTYAYTLRLRSDPSINMHDIVIDTGIYKVGAQMANIRMIYSSKLDKCVLCNDDTFCRQSCILCKSRGLIVSNFTYEPRFVIIGDDDDPSIFAEYISKDYITMVRNTSIWPEEKDKRDDYCKPIIDPEVTDESKKRKQPSVSSQVCNTKLISNVIFDALEEEFKRIQINGEHPWKDLTIKSITPQKTGGARIYVDGIGSNFCLYANKDHGSRGIYFQLSRKSVMTFRCNAETYGCDNAHKDDDRVIKFTISQRITNDIFGIPNAPSLNSPQMILDGKKSNKQSEHARHLTELYNIKKTKK